MSRFTPRARQVAITDSKFACNRWARHKLAMLDYEPPKPAIGHMPFPGLRKVSEIPESEMPRTNYSVRRSDFGFGQ